MMTSIQQYGGYQFELVQKFDDNMEDILMCMICHLPSRDPQLSSCCGHTFCKSCLDSIKQFGRTRSTSVCPVCRDKAFQAFPNKQADRKIRRLDVFCSNKEKGCEWHGEINDVEVHLNNTNNNNGCQYEDVECVHGCGKRLQRQYIMKHMEIECLHRTVDCQYCSLSGIHNFITGAHKEECPKVVISCPNGCEVNDILREEMDEHKGVCPLEVISCKYIKLGCKTKMAREEENKHGKEKMEEHLFLAIDKLERLENAVSHLENFMSQLKWSSYLTSLVASGSQTAPITIMITGFAYKKIERIRWESAYFFTEDEGHEMFIKITFARVFLKVYLSLGPNKDSDDLDWPLRGRFDIVILNQISDNKHYSRKIVYDDRCSDAVAGLDATESWGISHFISYDQLCKASATCQYVKEDCLYIKVSYSRPIIEDDQ